MICGKCRKETESRNHSWCKKCHAEYMRNWRKNKPLTELQKKKDIARSYAGVYLRKGYIKKEPCSICGNEKSEMHHEDYDRPIDITWLCRKHHLELHKKDPTRRNNLTFHADS